MQRATELARADETATELRGDEMSSLGIGSTRLLVEVDDRPCCRARFNSEGNASPTLMPRLPGHAAFKTMRS